MKQYHMRNHFNTAVEMDDLNSVLDIILYNLQDSSAYEEPKRIPIAVDGWEEEHLAEFLKWLNRLNTEQVWLALVYSEAFDMDIFDAFEDVRKGKVVNTHRHYLGDVGEDILDSIIQSPTVFDIVSSCIDWEKVADKLGSNNTVWIDGKERRGFYKRCDERDCLELAVLE